MASYRKRGDKWRAEVFKNNVRDSQTFDTKREAVEWAQKREAELSAMKSGKVIRKTLGAVMQRYSDDISPNKDGGDWEVKRIVAFLRDERILAAMVMQDVTAADLAAYRDRRLKLVKPSSVLREISLWRAIWTQARRGEWRYVDHDPWKEVTKPKDSAPRDVLFVGDQVEKIVAALKYTGGQPTTKRQQTAVALLLALETAMRASEIVGLTWPRVDLVRRVAHLPKTKNGDARDVPLSRRAVELLQAMIGLDGERVFTVDSASLDTNYRLGRAAAGISGPTFHDSRATAITRLAKKLELLELARMSGHRDPRSLMIYYRKTASEIASKLDD